MLDTPKAIDWTLATTSSGTPGLRGGVRGGMGAFEIANHPVSTFKTMNLLISKLNTWAICVGSENASKLAGGILIFDETIGRFFSVFGGSEFSLVSHQCSQVQKHGH